MSRSIKFRYVIRHKATQNVITYTVSILDIEKYEGIGWMTEMITGIPVSEQKNYELLSRDQFTGLFDKNGTEIYEGDIIKVDDREYLTPIEYWRGWAWFGFPRFDDKSVYNDFKMEVVGNIYQHPELLKNT